VRIAAPEREHAANDIQTNNFAAKISTRVVYVTGTERKVLKPWAADLSDQIASKVVNRSVPEGVICLDIQPSKQAERVPMFHGGREGFIELVLTIIKL
jgi:hypothetical protein